MKTETQNAKTENAAWDAVIVGAGPAGSVAACLLARRGWRVLLVERSPWPRDKACGGCLNAAGIRLLRESGLGDVLTGTPALSRIQLHRGRSRAAFDLPAGVLVQRRDFDARLVQAAVDAGCTFMPGTSARLQPDQNSACRTVSLQNAGGTVTATARVVLACDGLGKPGRGFLAAERWAGVTVADAPRLGFSFTRDAEANFSIPTGSLVMCVAAHGYVGLVQSPANAIHVGAALLPHACHARGGPIAVIKDILDRSSITMPPFGASCPIISGTGPLTCHRDIVGHGRVLALGDAAGYVEPFTGEGISWAIRAAVAVTGLLPQNATQITEAVGTQWNRYFNTYLRPRQHWCRGLRLLLSSPAITGMALHAVRHFPQTATRLAKKISA